MAELAAALDVFAAALDVLAVALVDVVAAAVDDAGRFRTPINCAGLRAPYIRNPLYMDSLCMVKENLHNYSTKLRPLSKTK